MGASPYAVAGRARSGVGAAAGAGAATAGGGGWVAVRDSLSLPLFHMAIIVPFQSFLTSLDSPLPLDGKKQKALARYSPKHILLQP
jgi:hypothetical protein